MDASGTPAGVAPSRGRDLSLRSFLLSPLDPATWRAFLAALLGVVVTGLAFNGLFIVWSIGGSLIVVLVGIPIIGLGIELCRYLARAERSRMAGLDGRPLTAHAYRPLDFSPKAPYDAWLRQYAEGQFVDVARWRDVVYMLIGFPLAVIELVIVLALWSLALGLTVATLLLLGPMAVTPEPVPAIAPAITALMALGLIPVASFVTRGVMLLHRTLVETLLCVSPTEALRQEAERLRRSRSAAVELEASELRRIERDLHDGAQQRLVMLAMDLGRAEAKIESDPAAAKKLIADAREQSQQALADLRHLVRGTAPSILSDRGLAAAVASIAGRGPVPTSIDSRRIEGQRFSPAVERAGYFAAAEALTNVAKHSGATRSDVIFRRDASTLYVEVWDNGRGGATIGPEGGLAGLRDRVATLDGTLQLTSPPGGPTMVRVSLPLRDAAAPAQRTSPPAAPRPPAGPPAEPRRPAGQG